MLFFLLPQNIIQGGQLAKIVDEIYCMTPQEYLSTKTLTLNFLCKFLRRKNVLLLALDSLLAPWYFDLMVTQNMLRPHEEK